MSTNKPGILKVLEEYGATLPPNPKTAGWSPVLCPFPGHKDRSPSAAVNTSTDRVMCFPCDRNEDSYGMIMLFENCTYPEAKRIAEARWGTVSRGKKGGAGKKAPKSPRGLWD